MFPKFASIGFILPNVLVNGLIANGRLIISFHSSEHMSRAPILFNKVHSLIILLLSDALITSRFSASCPSALVGFKSPVGTVVSTAITSNFARNRTLMASGEPSDLSQAKTLLLYAAIYICHPR